MIRLHDRVGGSLVQVNVIESDDDLREAFAFITDPKRPEFSLCVDTETTGLNVYSPTFRIRTFQVGDENTAYVYRLTRTRDRNARELLRASLLVGASLHNRPYDLLAFDATGILPLESTVDRARCTQLTSHLLDPRAQQDGGIGHGLKTQSAFYVDPSAPDTQDGLKAIFAENGWTLETGWALIDTSNPTYLLYAGLDVILGARLFSIQRRLINERGYNELAWVEHAYQNVTMRMQRRGFRIDVPYVDWMLTHLEDQRLDGIAVANSLGVANINSSAQIAEILLSYGWNPRDFTKTGKPKLDKAVMKEIMEDRKCPPDVKKLLQYVGSSKQAGKWKTAYAEAMLNRRDSSDHVHAWINSLQARTGRSSISNPPLQQLPSRGDNAWLIRRAVIADEGKVLGSCDLDQVEFRILAALGNISAMKFAIENGIDLHDYTAQLIYGEEFTKGQRNMMKGVGFGKVFGGGARTLSRQTGAPIDAVKFAISEYERVYFELPQYQQQLISEMRRNGGFIHTYYHRYMPVDLDREYALVNYSVQSPAADWLKRRVIDMSKLDGIDACLLLPVHDEILWQADTQDAEEVCACISDSMSGTFVDVPISAGGEIYGQSWGHGYVDIDAQGVVRSKSTKNIIEHWR